MSEKKKYELKTLEDVVVKIPENRIDAFLVDFKLFIETSKSMVELFNDITAFTEGLDSEVPEVSKMTWIDDGKNDIGVNIEIKDQKQ